MQYETIALGLLQQCPQRYEQLRENRTLLPTMEAYARALKTNHELAIYRLRQARPGCDRRQLASEALEIALHQMEDDLSFASEEDEGPTLDGAMAHLRLHTPRA